MMRSIDVKKLKPLSSSVELLSHQFLQKCSVSGTAKGKGKLKAAMPLKRSKITVNKGKGESSGDKSLGGRHRSEFDELLDNCMEATSPIRHLKPKEKQREAERERMGLISKARAKEIELLKKKTKNIESDKPIMGTPGFDLIKLGIVDGDAVPKYELTVEDGRRLAKEYSRVLMTEHRARQRAESGFLKLKNEALEALPEHLRVAALVPDKTPFPGGNHFMPTLTPPIEGYLEKINEAAKRSSMKQKLR